MKRLVWIAAFLLGVPILGVGIPLVWVWAASQVQPRFQGVGVLPLAVLAGGIFGTYLLVTVLAHWVNPRPPAPAARRRPASWNEPMSGRRPHAPDASSSTGVESFFVITTMLVAAASEVYLIFFAHPGVPAGP